MKRQHTYEQLIGRKLDQLTPPDVTGLWSQMEAILDAEMPQQEEKKRRFGGWWLSANVLIAASLVTVVGCMYAFNGLDGKRLAVQAKQDDAQARSAQPHSASVQTDAPLEQADAAKAQSFARAQMQPPVIASYKESNESLLRSAEEMPLPNKGGAERNPLPAQTEKAAIDNRSNEDFEAPVSTASEGQEQQLPATKQAVIGFGANGNVGGTDRTAVALTPQVGAASAGTGQPSNAVALADLIETALPVDVETEKINVPSVFTTQTVRMLTVAENKRRIGLKKRPPVYFDKGISVGVSLNLPVATGGQQKNELDMNGKANKWQDYVPSVYAQVHLTKMFSIKAEWMPVTAQYTPNRTLYHSIAEPSPDEKEEKIVKLNKLFYTSIPVSVQYNTPLKGVTVGAGVQYSLLKKMILQDQEYYHLIGAGGWNVTETKNEIAVKDPNAVREHTSSDVVDGVARAFKREDWRLLADVGYSYKGLNAGVRYTKGLQNYINSNFTGLAVKDKNSSLQVYLRYNIFDTRKK